MTFEITIWRWIIRFSLFAWKEEEPQEIEYEVFYNLTINEAGEIVKIPMYKPFV